MRTKPLLILPALLALTLPLSLQADETSDAILAEIKALRAQVESLEARVAALESQPEAPVAETPKREQRKWFDNLNIELKKAELRASGAWTDPSVWDQIETGLEKEEVVAILGEPTRFKFSVRRDTDEILIYEGDLEGDGEPVYGEIRIYKGKVRRFIAPDFPSAE